MSEIEGYSIQNGEPTPDNPAEIRSLDIEDIKFIDETVKEYNTFGDLDNPDYEDTDRIYETIEHILAERKQDKARIQELQDMLKEKDKEIEKKDKIIEQINKDIEANIYLAESNYNVEELNDYARGVYDTYINMRMQYFERKARDERD